MNILFLSCMKATELIEKRLHFKLSLKEKIKLKLHKMMCDACSRYEKQSIFLEKGISAKQQSKQPEIDMKELKKNIADKIDNKGSKLI